MIWQDARAQRDAVKEGGKARTRTGRNPVGIEPVSLTYDASAMTVVHSSSAYASVLSFGPN